MNSVCAGATVGENVLLTVMDPLMFPITAVSIDTLNVEGTWRFAKDKGRKSIDVFQMVEYNHQFHLEKTFFATAVD